MAATKPIAVPRVIDVHPVKRGCSATAADGVASPPTVSGSALVASTVVASDVVVVSSSVVDVVSAVVVVSHTVVDGVEVVDDVVDDVVEDVLDDAAVDDVVDVGRVVSVVAVLQSPPVVVLDVTVLDVELVELV